MTTRFLLPLAAAAFWLGLGASVPAGAVKFAQSGKSFETLMQDSYRIVAASSTPGLVVPLLVLRKGSLRQHLGRADA